MHNLSNFWLACFKWTANLFDYYRPFRCDAVMQIIDDLSQTILYTANKFNVASKIQNDTHFLQNSGFPATGVHNFLNQETD